MINIVIYNNNLKFIKKYCNIISTNFNSSAKIAGIASTKSELDSIYERNIIDLIIIDLNTYNKKSISDYLRSIKYKVVICDRPIKSRRCLNTLYILNNSDNSTITYELKTFINKPSENIVRKSTLNLLESLGFDFKLKGTNYLLEAIVYSYLNKNAYLYDNLEKNIYTFISQKYNVSNSVVKHSIIRSINSTNSNSLKSYFNNLDRITSKTLISEIVNRI